ncbi:MAG: NigD-like protein [Tannerella sp.]|nr:NigD-like protein [Tannerella sp.]
MKTVKLIFACASVLAASCVCNSCMDDDGYSLGNVWYSMATVVPSDDSPTYYLRLDHGTTLWPAATNIPWYVPKEKHRALAYYTVLSDTYYDYDHAVKVLDIQDVLTKPIAEDRGEENDSYFGNDPVRILDLWVGDGYLNVKFEFSYGGSVKHFINLVKRNSEDTPRYFEFRHNAYQDNAYVQRKGIVSFDLSSLETGGEEIQLTIRVKTPEGEKDYTVKYNPESEEQTTNTVEQALSGDGDFVEIV